MIEPQYLAQDFAEIWGDVGGFRTLVLNEQIDKCQGNVIGKDSEMFPFQVLPLPAVEHLPKGGDAGVECR